jgi:hypothetical protein
MPSKGYKMWKAIQKLQVSMWTRLYTKFLTHSQVKYNARSSTLRDKSDTLIAIAIVLLTLCKDVGNEMVGRYTT